MVIGAGVCEEKKCTLTVGGSLFVVLCTYKDINLHSVMLIYRYVL